MFYGRFSSRFDYSCFDSEVLENQLNLFSNGGAHGGPAADCEHVLTNQKQDQKQPVVSNTYLLTLLMVTPYPHRAPITPFVEPIAPFLDCDDVHDAQRCRGLALPGD